MDSREVTKAAKDDSGVVNRIGGPWGTRPISGVAIDILHNQYRYFVKTEAGEVDLRLVQGEDRRYVRIQDDLDEPDRLAALPDI